MRGALSQRELESASLQREVQAAQRALAIKDDTVTALQQVAAAPGLIAGPGACAGDGAGTFGRQRAASSAHAGAAELGRHARAHSPGDAAALAGQRRRQVRLACVFVTLQMADPAGGEGGAAGAGVFFAYLLSPL